MATTPELHNALAAELLKSAAAAHQKDPRAGLVYRQQNLLAKLDRAERNDSLVAGLEAEWPDCPLRQRLMVLVTEDAEARQKYLRRQGWR